jgi:Gas vesicle synthesis protein GvpO
VDLATVASQAKKHLSDMTGLKPVTITSIHPGNGGWQVWLELLEMSRIPAATDVIGEYEVDLDDDGGLLGFERKGMRLRGQANDDRESRG